MTDPIMPIVHAVRDAISAGESPAISKFDNPIAKLMRIVEDSPASLFGSQVLKACVIEQHNISRE